MKKEVTAVPSYPDSMIDPVFRSVCSHWLSKIEMSARHRKKVFSNAAEECHRFYVGPRSWEGAMAGDVGGLEAPDLPADPAFKVSINKVFEFVGLFGPTLYARNPVRTVKPRQPIVVPPQFLTGPNGPMAGMFPGLQQQGRYDGALRYQMMLEQEHQRIQQEGLISVLLESYLNWTPNEFKLDLESRQAIDEALVRGRGLLWTEVYQPPGSQMNCIRSTWDPVNFLYCDPDAHNFQECTWIARKRVRPVWRTERHFGLERGSLKGNFESLTKQADFILDPTGDELYERSKGNTNDLIIYYEIFSKMGAGGRLAGINKSYREPLEYLGDYIYLVVAQGIPFPLNLPPNTPDRADVQQDPSIINDMLSWPTPFWTMNDWPCTELDFHRVFNSPWPQPHIKAGMGELKFIQWAMSFLMGKLRNTTRDFIAIKKEAGEEIKSHILNGGDLTLLELEAEHGTISELVQFLQHPQINGDIWKMITEVEDAFDRRVGLNELMYGMQGESAIRSALEANVRTTASQIRPEDMRQTTEAWMTRVSAKEGMAARYHLQGSDVKPVFGAMGSQAWDQYVHSRDIDLISKQLDFRIESDSTARPNRSMAITEINNATNVIGPILQNWAARTGDIGALNQLLTDWAKAHNLDASKYMLNPQLSTVPPQPSAPGEEVRDVSRDTQGQEAPQPG